jgi:hypothetical protein
VHSNFLVCELVHFKANLKVIVVSPITNVFMSYFDLFYTVHKRVILQLCMHPLVFSEVPKCVHMLSFSYAYLTIVLRIGANAPIYTYFLPIIYQHLDDNLSGSVVKIINRPQVKGLK